MMFEGFPEETTQFFLDVRFHNSTAWYTENKDRYYSDVRNHFYSFINELAPYMLAVDHQMEIRPFKCLSRLRRDVRFTKDKSPYRDHLWLCFHRAGEQRDGANMFWFELSPECATYGMGFWNENKAVNERVRRNIAAEPQYFQQLLSSCNLQKHGLVSGGDIYKRIEYPPSVPAELRPYYARRDPLFVKSTNDMAFIHSPKLFDDVLLCFNALAPLYKYYRGYMDEEIAEKADEDAESSENVHRKIIEEW